MGCYLCGGYADYGKDFWASKPICSNCWHFDRKMSDTEIDADRHKILRLRKKGMISKREFETLKYRWWEMYHQELEKLKKEVMQKHIGYATANEI